MNLFPSIIHRSPLIIYHMQGIDDIITDIIQTKTSERGATRIDDRLSEAAMEDRKLNGYF